jgi:hypothetical protein
MACYRQGDHLTLADLQAITTSLNDERGTGGQSKARPLARMGLLNDLAEDVACRAASS